MILQPAWNGPGIYEVGFRVFMERDTEVRLVQRSTGKLVCSYWTARSDDVVQKVTIECHSPQDLELDLVVPEG